MPATATRPKPSETESELDRQIRVLNAEMMLSFARLQDSAPFTPEVQAEVMDIIAEVPEIVDRKRKVWAEGVPPLSLDRFCMALDGMPLFPRQRAAFEAIGMLEPESVIAKNRAIHQAILVYGKGSGKDYMIAKFVAWMFYVLCSLEEDPATYFDLAPESRLSIINVASTAEQAKNVFFTQYLKRFIGKPLFKKFKLINSEVRRAKADEGKMGADSIIYRRRGEDGGNYECIGIYSMHSKATSLEGHNVFASIMDEADAMLDNAERSNAQEVYNVLQSSSQRFQGNYFMGIISYPRIKDGFMMRKHNEALEEMRLLGPKASMWTDIAPTWEVNPKFNREDPDIIRQFRVNFAEANAKYGCVPMEAVDAFFDFPEQIDMAIDHHRSPCAVVTVEHLNIPLDNGSERYFVTGVVGAINRTPGYEYYLAGDAGAKKDAYALAIFHVDANPDSAMYLCPSCGRDPITRQNGAYREFKQGERIKYDPAILCGICWTQPHEIHGYSNNGMIHMQGFWQRENRDESTLRDAEGRAYNIGKMYEDLIVQIKPQRAYTSEKNTEGGRNRIVYFPAIQDMCRKLIEGLGITAARFDPHQTYEITQGLMASTGGDIGELSQSNPEQLRRGSFVKTMLHSGLISLLPNEERDKEWKRLQFVRGMKLDHPDGGSKDIWDAESMAIWTAATNRCSTLDVSWIG